MERNPLSEHEKLMAKNYANLCCIKYMMLTGVIKTEAEFASKGYAEALHMLLNGVIRVAKDEEVEEQIKQVKKLIQTT